MNNQFDETLARRIITDLVKGRVIVNDDFTLKAPLWGYQGDIAFKDEQQAVDQLVTACRAHYGTGLRATG